VTRDVYKETLLRDLRNLKVLQQTKEGEQEIAVILEFCKETQLFLPDILSKESRQSIADLVSHGPSGKEYDVFTFATSSAVLETLNR